MPFGTCVSAGSVGLDVFPPFGSAPVCSLRFPRIAARDELLRLLWFLVEGEAPALSSPSPGASAVMSPSAVAPAVDDPALVESHKRVIPPSPATEPNAEPRVKGSPQSAAPADTTSTEISSAAPPPTTLQAALPMVCSPFLMCSLTEYTVVSHASPLCFGFPLLVAAHLFVYTCVSLV